MKFSKQMKSGMIAAGVAASALMGAQSALAVSVKVDQFVEAKDPWGHGRDERRHLFLH